MRLHYFYPDKGKKIPQVNVSKTLSQPSSITFGSSQGSQNTGADCLRAELIPQPDAAGNRSTEFLICEDDDDDEDNAVIHLFRKNAPGSVPVGASRVCTRTAGRGVT